MYAAMSDIKVTICCKNHLDTVDILITGYKNDQKYSRSIILQVIKFLGTWPRLWKWRFERRALRRVESMV